MTIVIRFGASGRAITTAVPPELATPLERRADAERDRQSKRGAKARWLDRASATEMRDQVRTKRAQYGLAPARKTAVSVKSIPPERVSVSYRNGQRVVSWW